MGAKAWNEYARKWHIKELERRGIEPTDENIQKLIEELEEIVKKLDKESKATDFISL